MCCITRDIEDGWLVEFVGWSDDVINANTQSSHPLNIRYLKGTEGALDFDAASPMKDTSEVRLIC